MPNLIDLTGKKFGRLTVIKRAPNKGTNVTWECKCDCGNDVIIRSGNILRNHTKSCGCLREESITKHGYSKFKGKNKSEYNSWSNMINRCTSKSHKSYHNYGGRGITVCDRWLHSFENFIEDMGDKPSPKYSIDRVDNNKGYSPDNCVWANSTQQAINKRVQSNNSTGVRGVDYNKALKKYRARIQIKGKEIHLGVFEDIEEAKQARKRAEIKYFGKSL